jgi:tryptophan synthase beta chain
VVDEAIRAREAGEEKVILFNLSGHGYFDMTAYDSYLAGQLQDYAYPEAAIAASLGRLPQVG